MIQIRRTPQTNVPTGQQGYAQAQPLDFTPIANSINQAREQILRNQRERQQFDLERRLIEETNALQVDFEERKRSPDQSPFSFAADIDAAYEERLSAVVQEYDELGYERDLVDEFSTRLRRLRSGFFEEGLSYQLQTYAEKSLSDSEQIISDASQLVMNDWNAYGETLDWFSDVIATNPDLTEGQRIQLRDQARNALKMTAVKSWAQSAPDELISTLDPEGRWTSEPEVVGSAARVVAEGAPGVVGGALASGGLSVPVIAGFLGNFDVEGGYEGAQGDGGTASGVAQWRGERRANFFAMFGKEPHEASLEEQAQFVLHEMQNPETAGMTVAQRDEILAAETPEKAAELIDKYYERSSGEHRQRRIEMAAQYGSLVRVDLPPSDARQSPFNPANAPQELEALAVDNRLLGDLSGEERLQALSWAQSAMTQNRSQQRAAMDVLINNVTAEALAGEVVSPIPTEEEVLAAYGPIEGPQRLAEMQSVLTTSKYLQQWTTASSTAIDAQLASMRPGAGDPAFATKMGVYEDAQRARNQITEARESDPAQFAIDNFSGVQEALASGNVANYHAAVRRAYDAMGIPAEQRSLYPQATVDQMKKLYPTLTGSQRVEKMVQWRSGATEEEFYNFVQQLEGTKAYDDAVIYEMMREWPGSRTTLPVIFDGRFMLEEDPARRPSSSAINTYFREEFFDGIRHLNPIASRGVNEAAIAIYVSRGGSPNMDAGGDVRLYRESLRQALGGVPDNPDTGWIDEGKNRVKDLTILPPRTTGRQFRNWVGSLTNRDFVSRGRNGQPRYASGEIVPAQDIIDEGTFTMVRPGVYAVKFGPNDFAFGDDGRPYLMNIDTATVRGR